MVDKHGRQAHADRHVRLHRQAHVVVDSWLTLTSHATHHPPAHLESRAAQISRSVSAAGTGPGSCLLLEKRCDSKLHLLPPPPPPPSLAVSELRPFCGTGGGEHAWALSHGLPPPCSHATDPP
uniref:Uncharacterized protein n=1 Tax=Haptolina ericina TaxID=156174 RepID=A0A7S3AC13_9EUKA